MVARNCSLFYHSEGGALKGKKEPYKMANYIAIDKVENFEHGRVLTYLGTRGKTVLEFKRKSQDRPMSIDRKGTLHFAN